MAVSRLSDAGRSLAHQMQAGLSGLPSREHTPVPTAPQLPQKAKGSFRRTGKSLSQIEAWRVTLVCASREQGNQHHQVGQRKKPLVRLFTRCFRGPRDEPQMAAFCEIADVIDTNACQVCDFRIGKNLLARFDGNHGLVPCTVLHSVLPKSAYKLFDAFSSVLDAPFVEQ